MLIVVTDLTHIFKAMLVVVILPKEIFQSQVLLWFGYYCALIIPTFERFAIQF